MNNEPVAWMYEKPNGASKLSFVKEKMLWEDMTENPLYAHPAKYCPSENNEAYEKGFIDGMAKMTESAVHRAVVGMAVKELTDEEINTEMLAYLNSKTMGLEDFAKAILRKAQEK
jgi:hypothetical protein